MSDDQGYSQQQMYEMLMESQYWSREQMQEYQRSQLEQMLRHAKANVPFYKTRLDCMFRRDGSINWDRWEEIPILTKEEVRENFEALQAIEYPASHGAARSNYTSGTTGKYLTFLHTELEMDLWQVVGWRANTWWKLDWTRNLMRWPQASETANPNEPLENRGHWGPPWIMTGQKSGYDLSMPRGLPLSDRLRYIRDNDVAFLSTLPNVAFAAALEFEQHSNWPSTKLDAILGFSNSVEPEHEQTCTRVFGASVHSSYSSTEAGRIAYSCEDNESYHLCEELIACELLDSSGDAVSHGESGEVVVTPFLSAAMPLIRYAQGDVARRLGPCRCGVSLQRISRIEGRPHHMFVRPDGLRIAPTVPDWIRSKFGILGWQFAQTSEILVEIRYLRSAPLSMEQQSWISDKLKNTLGDVFKLKVLHVATLKETPSGKFIKFVNEYSTKR